MPPLPEAQKEVQPEKPMLHVHQGACLLPTDGGERQRDRERQRVSVTPFPPIHHPPHRIIHMPADISNNSTIPFSSRSFVSQAHPPLRGRGGSRQRTSSPAWPGARSSCGGISSVGSVSSARIRPQSHLQRARRRRLQRGSLRSSLIRAYPLRRLLLLLFLPLDRKSVV